MPPAARGRAAASGRPACRTTSHRARCPAERAPEPGRAQDDQAEHQQEGAHAIADQPDGAGQRDGDEQPDEDGLEHDGAGRQIARLQDRPPSLDVRGPSGNPPDRPSRRLYHVFVAGDPPLEERPGDADRRGWSRSTPGSHRSRRRRRRRRTSRARPGTGCRHR